MLPSVEQTEDQDLLSIYPLESLNILDLSKTGSSQTKNNVADIP